MFLKLSLYIAASLAKVITTGYKQPTIPRENSGRVNLGQNSGQEFYYMTSITLKNSETGRSLD